MSDDRADELESLGLWGDGDEVAAIQRVEERFGASLDYANANEWRTVGDVFQALLCAVPSLTTQITDPWELFAQTISLETAVDWTKVRPDTPLLTNKHSRLGFIVIVVLGSLVGCVAALWRP